MEDWEKIHNTLELYQKSSEREFILVLPSGRRVELKPGTQLTGRDIPGLVPKVSGAPILQVIRHPQDSRVEGLQNLSTTIWFASQPGGDQRRVDPERSVKLADGTQVNFGCGIGTIQYSAATAQVPAKSKPLTSPQVAPVAVQSKVLQSVVNGADEQNENPAPISISSSVAWVNIGAIHGLIINPLLWCLVCSMIYAFGEKERILAREAPSFPLECMLHWFFRTSRHVLLGAWLIGGWGLLRRRRRGLWVSRAACTATNIYCLILVVATTMMTEFTKGEPGNPDWHPPSKLKNLAMGWSMAIAILEIIFQNVIVHNLWRKRAVIIWADGPFPENRITLLKLQPAATWDRFFASFAIDGVIVWILFIIAAYGITGVRDGLGGEHDIWIPTFVAWFVISWLYSALLESSAYCGTFGKIAKRIKVVDMNGERISFSRATRRYLMKYISTLCCFFGYLIQPFTNNSQALHDLSSDTLVVKDSGELLPTTGGIS